MRPSLPALPDGFLELPAQVYAGDPLWIPEAPEGVRRAFSSANAWFRRGQAEVWCRPGKARLAAFRYPECTVDGRPAAFFGYWETTAGETENAPLFLAAERWTAERGARALYGPINFTTFGTYRLRTRAEPGGLPFPGEPYNPPHYPGLLRSLGYSPCQRYLTQILEPASFARLIERLRRHHQAVSERGYRFADLSGLGWEERPQDLHALTHRVFRDNFAYTPVPFESFAQAAGPELLRRACPRTSFLILDAEGALVGFLLAFPHWGPVASAGATSERVPLSSLRFDRHLPLLRRRVGKPDILLKTLGTAPGHRHGLLKAALVEAYSRAGERWNRWWPALMNTAGGVHRVGERSADFSREYLLYGRPLSSP